jgi:hypothetical protein
MAEPRLVELLRLPARLQAEVLVAQLGSQGVKAVVFDSGPEAFEIPSLVLGVRVMVAESDLALAREMAEELLGSQ